MARTLGERFWSKVKKTPGCWLWIGSKGGQGGYGTIRLGSVVDGTRRHVYSHRLSYEMHHGRIPKGMFVLHKCDTPSCVRPDHLFLGSHAENMEDMRNKGRSSVGEKNVMAKLTLPQVQAIKDRLSNGWTQRKLAKEYGVTFQAINLIAVGKNWSHI